MNDKFIFEVDGVKKILKFKMIGSWDIKDGDDWGEEFKQKSKSLLGGKWYVLADLSEFPAQKSEIQQKLAELMEFAGKNGMKKAANLVQKQLSKMQIERLSAESGLPAFSFFQDENEAIEWLVKD